jgi:WD40 repeat protein
MVRVWNVEDGAEWITVTGHSEPVETLAFSPVENLLATGSQDGTVRLVELDARKEIGVLEGHLGIWVENLLFSPDGRLLLTSAFQQIIVWQVATQELLFEYMQPEMFSYLTWFTADSRYAVIEGRPEESIAWEVATGKSIPLQEFAQLAEYRRMMVQPRAYWWRGRAHADSLSGTLDQPPELVLQRAATGEPVAWLPIPYGGILYHPLSEIWGVHRGGHLQIYALETL